MVSGESLPTTLSVTSDYHCKPEDKDVTLSPHCVFVHSEWRFSFSVSTMVIIGCNNSLSLMMQQISPLGPYLHVERTSLSLRCISSLPSLYSLLLALSSEVCGIYTYMCVSHEEKHSVAQRISIKISPSWDTLLS